MVAQPIVVAPAEALTQGGSESRRVDRVTPALPTSTYRLQISANFTLDDAIAELPRLADLGVDCVYLSPLLTSTRGSDHGYDWVDCRQVDPERGGEEAWARFVPAARAQGLKILLDIVPNHCGVAEPDQNPFWWDVLANGQGSAYAHWFDIDWSAGAVVMPVLGEDGSLDHLSLSPDRTRLMLGEMALPVADGSAGPEDAASDVLARQHYRLVPWTGTDLNYRRFFSVTTLAGLRIEDESVFEATHERIFRMVDEGQLDGLRVDHPDGLTDPGEYFTRLRARVGENFWLLGEKILADGEDLPQGWPIEGTTGYDAMAEVTRVLTAPGCEAWLDEQYRGLTHDQFDLDTHILGGKQFVLRTMFGPERARLLRVLPEAARGERTDEVLVELVARMEVYRTYLPTTRAALDEAAARLRADRPDLAEPLEALLPVLGDIGQEAASRFQQLSGAAMAKGLEDTAWYRYSRFIAANEVGGEPGRLSTTLAGFHADQQRRARDLPQSMTALSTHDTKRGEDVRAALATLSELPDAFTSWAMHLQQRSPLTERTMVHFLAQTLAGVGPVEPERLHDYMTKAIREAATGTSWSSPNEGYEAAVHDTVDLAYSDPELSQHWAQLRLTMLPGAAVNVLTQKLVQLTMPGIPDVYRGTEILEDSLVDPDNRRPVDQHRVGQAHSTVPPLGHDLDQRKHWVVRQTLRLRRDHPELFTSYAPVGLPADHALAEHLIGFDRGGAITLATRMPLMLAAAGGWGEANLELEGTHTDVLTGRTVSGRMALSEVFSSFPVALLQRG